MSRRKDQQVVLNFLTRTDEPFYIAWERYEGLFQFFPNNGFAQDGQILNFLNELTGAIRS